MAKSGWTGKISTEKKNMLDWLLPFNTMLTPQVISGWVKLEINIPNTKTTTQQKLQHQKSYFLNPSAWNNTGLTQILPPTQNWFWCNVQCSDFGRCQLCISLKMSGLDLDKIHEVLTSCQTLARCWFPRTGLSLNEKFNCEVHSSLLLCTLSFALFQYGMYPKTYVFCTFSDI